LRLGVILHRLSYRDKSKLYSLTFKPVATTSASLRAQTGARAKTDEGEEATDADVTAFCTTAASTRNKLLAAKETTMTSVGGVVVAIVAATTRFTLVTASKEFKPELNKLPTTEKRFLLRKESSKQVDDGCAFKSCQSFLETLL
jgi:hypothetical protein